jgi:hypothetical protein
MAFVTGGKHFGQYTYEHWFDGEYEKKESENKDDNRETPQLSEEEMPEKESIEKKDGD